MGMIKVPFDTNGHHGTISRGEIVTMVDLNKTLENAYQTMDWFKYLADHALSVEVLDQYYDGPKHLTTHVIGFELESKHETFYRIKYEI